MIVLIIMSVVREFLAPAPSAAASSTAATASVSSPSPVRPWA